jgi:hypothetical protein
MNLWRDAKHDLATRWPLGCRTKLFGCGQVVFDGGLEVRLKLSDGLAVEGGDVDAGRVSCEA